MWLQERAPPGTVLKERPSYQISLLVELACLGQGIAVLPSLFVERELANGTLVAPFGPPIATDSGYYLCYADEDANRPKFVRFRQWLLAQG